MPQRGRGRGSASVGSCTPFARAGRWRSIRRRPRKRSSSARRSSASTIAPTPPVSPGAATPCSEPHPHRVHREAQAKADEPRVVVQVGPRGGNLHLRHGGEEPGQTGSDAGGEGDEGGNVKAAAIPVGPALAVQAGQVQACATDEEV